MHTRIAAVLLLLSAAPAPSALAGPLNPPAGAISSSMKSLEAVEPRTAISAEATPGDGTSVYKITTPGSYYLTGNLFVPAGKHAILVAVPGVTLDLNGFTVSGESGSNYGVTTTAAVTAGPTVRNGRFHNLGAGLFSTTGGVCARDLRFHSCNYGLVAGEGAIVEDCTAMDTGTGAAFAISFNGVISRCTTVGGDGYGFEIYEGSTAKDCSARSHTSGFRLNTKSNAVDCTANFCSIDGFSTGIGVLVERCGAHDCGDDGIHAGSRARVIDCTATSNAAAGVRLDDPSATLSVHSTVKGLFARNNGTGIAVADTGCTITGNRCTNNSVNYNIVANNYVGPIVTSPVSAAINGSSGGAGLGTTDPSANFVN